MSPPLNATARAPIASEVELVLDARSRHGEGPVWDPRRRELLWVDISDGVIHRFDPETGADLPHHVGQPVGAVAPRASGGLVLALRDGFAMLEGEHLRWIADTEAERPTNRMNDGKVDPAGRFWAGTMAFDARPGAGSLYRLDQDHRVHTMLTGLTISNGLGWSPDGSRMYFIDSGTGGVDVFDCDTTGAIRGRRRLVAIAPEDGLPDGMAVDTEGFLWVALWGGWAVRRYAPDGSLERVIDLPVSQVTSCAFGGPDLSDLYITSAAMDLSQEQLEREPHAGSLFRCRPGVRGQAVERFRG